MQPRDNPTVRVRLVDASRPLDGALEVFLNGADAYTDSFAFDKAMDDATLLAVVVRQRERSPLLALGCALGLLMAVLAAVLVGAIVAFVSGGPA